MKKLVIIILILSFVSFGCDTGNGSNSLSDSKQPKFADLTNAQALFIGANNTSNTKSVDIQNNILYKINSEGNILPVTFTDDDGNIIKVQVSDLSKKSKNYFCFYLAIGNSNFDYSILAEASTGRLFLLDGVDIRYCVSEILGTKEILYTSLNTGIIYKLNIETLNAVPLNNPKFDSFSGYFWYFDNQQNAVFALPQPDNYIIINDHPRGAFRLDLNGITPPEKVNSDNIYGYPLNSEYLNISNKLPIFSINGSFYSFETSGKDLDVYLNGEYLETLTGALTSNNKMLNINAHYAYDMDDMYIYKSGVLRLILQSDGKIDYNYQPKNLEYLFENGAKYYYKNGIIYCLNGNVFKRADPLIDEEYTVIFNSTKKVKKSWMIDENIFFSAYNTATSVSTYVIIKGETVATEISSSEMEIVSVMELTF